MKCRPAVREGIEVGTRSLSRLVRLLPVEEAVIGVPSSPSLDARRVCVALL